MKYRVFDSNDNHIDIRIEENKLFLNDNEISIDMSKISDEKFNVIKDYRSYNLELVKADFEEKTFTIKVNDDIFELNLKDELDLQLDKMGMSKNESEKIDKIIAPMPGLVLKVFTTVGQEVKKGDSLLILEAMKMENIIKSPGSGIVKEIKVKEQDAIEKNHVLIIME
ncbi:MAG: acetyl-CoA carboxylase biotin carboxyl carrier protein subunit [Chitinophagales bacterium]|nr:acetyl-CoA carboxylase biotin carboxyl carrier protein subunit [Chitinophagales bacterium]